jgi:hypothetical protein
MNVGMLTRRREDIKDSIQRDNQQATDQVSPLTLFLRQLQLIRDVEPSRAVSRLEQIAPEGAILLPY